MGVLGDCLSLVLVDAKTVEVWVMQDYGVRESWTKRFTTTTQEPIIQYPYWTPMLSLKTGDILMYSYDGFALCDPKKERIGKVSGFFQENICIVRVLTMITSHPQSYVESLVSLNSGTYVKKPRGQKSSVALYSCAEIIDWPLTVTGYVWRVPATLRKTLGLVIYGSSENCVPRKVCYVKVPSIPEDGKSAFHSISDEGSHEVPPHLQIIQSVQCCQYCAMSSEFQVLCCRGLEEG
ncbi:hypothetical protein C5167_004626 [Papaver somniferum]|uniref:F-box associated domain-containing protein n=1 Tax=Papaver somniferum TaxID=3469 RepID=A0A4Y7JB79_PAPSO|nr:hypothetical protein C5167_004626 [Papaver somniferum]